MKPAKLILAAMFCLAATCAFAGFWDFSRNSDRDRPPPPPPPRHDWPPRAGEDWRDDRRPPPRHDNSGYHNSRPGRFDERPAPGPDYGPDNVKAPKGYVLAGVRTANGGVECGNPATKPIKTVRVVCTSGTVVVNTLVVREGAGTTQIPVMAKLTRGQFREIPLGSPRRATGLRFGTSGGGTLSVFVH